MKRLLVLALLVAGCGTTQTVVNPPTEAYQGHKTYTTVPRHTTAVADGQYSMQPYPADAFKKTLSIQPYPKDAFKDKTSYRIQPYPDWRKFLKILKFSVDTAPKPL